MNHTKPAGPARASVPPAFPLSPQVRGFRQERSRRIPGGSRSAHHCRWRANHIEIPPSSPMKAAVNVASGRGGKEKVVTVPEAPGIRANMRTKGRYEARTDAKATETCRAPSHMTRPARPRGVARGRGKPTASEWHGETRRG